ncbi:MAG: LysM domain-containing protein [Desulfobacterales bacterium]
MDRTRDEEKELFESPEREEIDDFDDGEEAFPGPVRTLMDGQTGSESFETEFDDDGYEPEMANPSNGLFSVLQKPSVWLGGAIGLVVILLGYFFLFAPGGSDVERNELTQLKNRIVALEDEILRLQNTMAIDTAENAEVPTDQNRRRIDVLESMVTAKTDKLQKDVETLALSLKDLDSKMNSVAQSADASAKSASGAASSSESITYYTVKKGDNLFRIALKYGLKESELMALNGLKKTSIIHPGDKLRVSK